MADRSISVEGAALFMALGGQQHEEILLRSEPLPETPIHSLLFV